MSAWRSRRTSEKSGRPLVARLARPALIGAAVSVAPLGGCAGSGGPDGAGTPGTRAAHWRTPREEAATGYWAARTAPTWVRIDRDATFVLAEADADLLALTTDKHVVPQDGSHHDDGPPLSRITWLFAIPTDADEGDRFAFVGAADGGPPQGWALEAGNERPRRVEISGFVTILERTADRLRVDVKAFPIDETDLPDLLEQIECVLVERPGAVATPPIETRTGVPHPPLPPKDPPRRATDAVWPWGEIFGDYPPPKYATK